MAIVAALDHRFDDLDIERRVLAPLGVDLRNGRGLDVETALALCVDADAILVGARLRLDRTVLQNLKRCRVIVRYGSGSENIDASAASTEGIWVACVPDYCIHEVADHTIALLLVLNRHIVSLDAAVRRGAWGIPQGLNVRRLSERILGVIGFGKIGEAVTHRAAGLGLRILATDPVRSREDVAAAGGTLVEMDELLRLSDYVTLHAPQVGAAPILDAARIAKLKPGALLINVARGGLVDEAALVRALASGRLGGAGLDVASSEPLHPPHSLLDLPNVILTPHSGWYSLEAVAELRTRAAQEVERVLAGGEPLHPLNEPRPRRTRPSRSQKSS